MKRSDIDIESMQKNAKEVSELLKIMAHPERLIVLCQLTQGEVGAGQLQQGSSLSQSAFSQHLGLLRKHGLVVIRKESQQVYYSLADQRSSRIIESLEQIFCE
ncbi:ArsR/SmtB family transcription factor [Vibrio sp. RC27]